MQRITKGASLRILLVGAALLGLTAALAATGLEKPVTTPPCDFVKGVLCAELPPDGATFGASLAPAFNPPERWRLAIWLDMPFLVAYATLLSLGLVAVARRRERARSTTPQPAQARGADDRMSRLRGVTVRSQKALTLTLRPASAR